MADLDITTEQQIEGLRDRVTAGDQLIVGLNASEGADIGDAHAPGGIIDGAANLGSDKPGGSDTPGGGGRGGGGSGKNQEHHCRLVAGFMGKKDINKTYTESVEVFRRNDLCDDPCEVPPEDRNRDIKQDLIWQPVIPIPVDPPVPPRTPPYTPTDSPPDLVPPPSPPPGKGEPPKNPGGKPNKPGGPHIEPDKKPNKPSSGLNNNPCDNNKSLRRNSEGNRENIPKLWFPFRDGSGKAIPKTGTSWFKTESLGDGQPVSSVMETDGRSVFQGPPATIGDGFLDNLNTAITCIQQLLAALGSTATNATIKNIVEQCQASHNFKVDGKGGLSKLKEIASGVAKCLGENINDAKLLDNDGNPLSSFSNDVLKCYCKAFISNKQKLGSGATKLEKANQADVPDTVELGRDIIPPTYVSSDGRTKDIIKAPGLTRAQISEALNGPDSFVFEQPSDLASFEGENQPAAQVEAGLPVAFNAVGDKGCPCSKEDLNHLLLTAKQYAAMIEATLERCSTAAYRKAKKLIKTSEKAKRLSKRSFTSNRVKNNRTLRNKRREAVIFNHAFARLMKKGYGRTDNKKPSTAAQVKQKLIDTGLPRYASSTSFPPFVSGGEAFDGSENKSFPFRTNLGLSDLPSSLILETDPTKVAEQTIENHKFYDDMENVIAKDGDSHTPGIEIGTSGQNKIGVKSLIRTNSCIPREFITRFIEGSKCKLDKNLGELLFGACDKGIAGVWNIDTIAGLSDASKNNLKNGIYDLPLKDWNTIFAIHKGQKSNAIDAIRNSVGSHENSIFKGMGGRDGFRNNEGFGGKLRNPDNSFLCSKASDLRGSTYGLKNYFRSLKRSIKRILGKYMRQLDEKCPKKKISKGERRRQNKRLGAGNPVNNNGNPDRKNRKQKKKTKRPVRRRLPRNNHGKRLQRWLNLAKGLQAIRRHSPSNLGNIPIYKNLSFFESTTFVFDDEAINDVGDKTEDQILDNFLNNLVPETLMPGSTFSTEEPETYSIETNLLLTDDFRIYLILTLGEDYGVSELFNKIMDHYHAQIKFAIALWNETVADSFPEAVIGRGIGLFAESMSLQPYIHAYPAPSPLNFLVPDGLPLAPNQFGVLVSIPALQDQVNLSFISSELSALRGLARLITRWTKGFARSYESLMGSTARVFIEGVDPVPTGITSLPNQLTNPYNLSDDTSIKIDSQLVSDTAEVIVEYIVKFGDAYAGSVNGGLAGLDVDNWGKPYSAIIGNLQNLTLDSLNLSTTDKINAAIFNGREALDKGISIDEDYRLESWKINQPPYTDTNPPKFSFTIKLDFGSSVPYDTNYTPGTNGPTVGQGLQKYVKEIFSAYLNDIQENAKQTKVGAHIIWPTNYPLPTKDELKSLVNTNGTPTNADDFSTIVLPGSTNILMIPKSRPITKNDADPLIPTTDMHTGRQPAIQHTVNQYGALIAPSSEAEAPEGAIPVAIGSVFPEAIPMSKMMDIIDLNFNVLYGWLGHVWQDGAPGSMNLVTVTGVDDPVPGKLTVIETDHTGVPLECKRPKIVNPLLPDDCYLPGDTGFAVPLKDKNNTIGFLPLKTFQISPRNIATGFTANEAARPPILGLNNTTFVNDGSGLGGSLSTVLENVINTVNKLVFNKRCAETQLISVPVSSADEVIEQDWPITFDSVPYVPAVPFEANLSGTSTLFTLNPFCLAATGGKFSVLGDAMDVFDSPVTVTVPLVGMTIPQNYKDNIIKDVGVKTEGACGAAQNQSGLTTDRTTQLTINELSVLPEETRSY